MRYLYRRGRGARFRVMHLCGYDWRTGEPTMIPLCGRRYLGLNTTINVPLGSRVCKDCARIADEGQRR